MASEHELVEQAEERPISGWRDLESRPKAGLWKQVRSRRKADWPWGTLTGFLLMPLGFAMPDLVFGFFLPVFGIALDLLRLNVFRARPTFEVDSMRDIPGPERQFPVSIYLNHKGITYGQDAGLLTVMEGGLQFSGQRCEFTLSRRNAWLRHDVRFQMSLFFAVDFRLEGFEGQVLIRPIGTLRTLPLSTGIASFDMPLTMGYLGGALHKWDTTPTSQQWEKLIDPPTTPHPARMRTLYIASLVAGTVFVASALVLAWLLISHMHTAHLADWQLYGTLFVVLCGFTAGLAAFSALRVLKPMERRRGE